MAVWIITVWPQVLVVDHRYWDPKVPGFTMFDVESLGKALYMQIFKPLRSKKSTRL